MAASSSWFANVSDEEIAELTLMQFLSQCSMQPSLVLKFLKVSQPLNLLVYLDTIQIATVSTAGAEIVNK